MTGFPGHVITDHSITWRGTKHLLTARVAKRIFTLCTSGQRQTAKRARMLPSAILEMFVCRLLPWLPVHLVKIMGEVLEQQEPRVIEIVALLLGQAPWDHCWRVIKWVSQSIQIYWLIIGLSTSIEYHGIYIIIYHTIICVNSMY